MSTKQHIFISPHYDDAVLSCGGQIAQLAATGEEVVVATVFGGTPNPDRLSPFAASIHARPGGGENLVALRQAEDARAMAVLRATSRPGDYLDCIYRQDEERTRWFYDHEAALYGPVAPAERGLAFELAQVFASLGGYPSECVLYAPLAIGNHVDHQILNKMAHLLQESGYTVYFYEDYPYVAREAAGLERALAQSRRDYWRSHLVTLDQDAMARKTEAIAAYGSQIGVLFGTPANVRPAIEAQARKVAGGAGYGERLWQCATATATANETATTVETTTRGPESPVPAAAEPSPGLVPSLVARLRGLLRA